MSSKQQQASWILGALGGRQSNRGPKTVEKKMVPRDPGMVLGRQTITFGTRKARVPAAQVLQAPEWLCPGRAPGGALSGPKMTKITRNGSGYSGVQRSSPKGSVVQVDGQN